MTRGQEVQPVHILDIPMEMVNIREWHPDAAGRMPAEQVHLVITLEDEDKTELGFTFSFTGYAWFSYRGTYCVS